MPLLPSLPPLRRKILSSPLPVSISRFSTSRSAFSSDEPSIDRDEINRILSSNSPSSSNEPSTNHDETPRPPRFQRSGSQADRLAKFRDDSDETTITAKLSGRGQPGRALGIRGMNRLGAVGPRPPIKCHFCGQEGHISRQCPTNPNAGSLAPGIRSRQVICYRCNQPGHLAINCPNAPVSRRTTGQRSPVFDGRAGNGPPTTAYSRKPVGDNDGFDDFDAFAAKEVKGQKSKKSKRMNDDDEAAAEPSLDVRELEENRVYSLPTSVNVSSILYDSMPKDVDEVWKHEVQAGSWMGGYGGSKYVDRLPVIPSLPTLEKTGILKNLKDRDIVREEDIKEMHDLRVHSTWHIKHWMPKDPPAPLPTSTSLTSPLPLPTTLLPLSPVRPNDTFPVHRPTFYRTQPLPPAIKKDDPVIPGGQNLDEHSRAAVVIAETVIARNDSLGPIGKEIAIAGIRKALLS